jgi:hypothetical protein
VRGNAVVTTCVAMRWKMRDGCASIFSVFRCYCRFFCIILTPRMMNLKNSPKLEFIILTEQAAQGD